VKALAIIPAFNEADIIGWTVRHLIAQGLDVYVIDSGSTDATVEVAIHAGATVEPYQFFGVPNSVSWRALLQEVEKHAEFQIGRYNWCMLCDADEIRRTPLSVNNLLAEFVTADAMGYNAIEFEVCTFHPIDNGFDGSQNPEEYFRHYTRDTFNERIGQVKAWKNNLPVNLAWSGGHRISYRAEQGIQNPLRVSPLKLISKHYPIRSQAHGERKVFQERRRRWSDPEKDWHVQYAGIEPGHNFLRDLKDLLLWSGV